MAAVGTRAGGLLPRLVALAVSGPLVDIDEPDHLSLPIDQEQGVQAVAEAKEAADRRQADVEAHRHRADRTARDHGSVLPAQQQGAGRDATILVSREAGDAEHL